MSGLTLGSLFSGSGAFELAGLRNGITPIWASELEPFAIRVTTKRLPQVRPVGDVTKLNGAELEPVSVVTMGSPCQNMSISSGRRTGLHGEKSSLFFEAIRVIREMREATNGTKPRWIVWENVFGALHSMAGADFREVLENLVRLKDPEATVPLPESRKWLPAGEILGDGYSLAWRVFDAQHHGVAQRRRRIYLVVDLDGERAGAVQFESEGLSGYTPPCGSERQAATAGAQGGAAGGGGAIGFMPGLVKRRGGHAWEEVCGTLLAETGDNAAAVAVPVYSIQGKIIGRQPFNQHGFGVNEDVCFTLDTTSSQHAVAYAMTCGSFASVNEDVAGTILHRDHKQPQIVAKHEGRRYIVRKLLPQEYAVLMGMPSTWCAGLETPEPTEADVAFWTDVFEAHRMAVNPSVRRRSRNQIIKWLKNPHTDAAEYKLWGNGLVLENASFVLAGIVWADGLDTQC